MANEQSFEYSNRFGGLVLEFWRRVTSPELSLLEARFIEQKLEVAPPAVLLDVACGLGRHAVELASRGFLVTGIDLSEECIDQARKAASHLAEPCEFILADMRQLSAVEQYDGLYCFGNSFGYLSPQATGDFLGRLAHALRSGGRAILDVGVVAEALLPTYHKRIEMTAGDITMVAVNHYDAVQSRMHTDLVFLQGKKMETRTTVQYVYTAGELRRMTEAAGLRYVAAYGTVSGEGFELGSDRFLLVSEKTP